MCKLLLSVYEFTSLTLKISLLSSELTGLLQFRGYSDIIEEHAVSFLVEGFRFTNCLSYIGMVQVKQLYEYYPSFTMAGIRLIFLLFPQLTYFSPMYEAAGSPKW
jgi:hypothetical protein